MKAVRLLPAVATLVAASVAGCASVPREAGFGDVRRVVADRTG